MKFLILLLLLLLITASTSTIFVSATECPYNKEIENVDWDREIEAQNRDAKFWRDFSIESDPTLWRQLCTEKGQLPVDHQQKIDAQNNIHLTTVTDTFYVIFYQLHLWLHWILEDVLELSARIRHRIFQELLFFENENEDFDSSLNPLRRIFLLRFLQSTMVFSIGYLIRLLFDDNNVVEAKIQRVCEDFVLVEENSKKRETVSVVVSELSQDSIQELKLNVKAMYIRSLLISRAKTLLRNLSSVLCFFLPTLYCLVFEIFSEEIFGASGGVFGRKRAGVDEMSLLWKIILSGIVIFGMCIITFIASFIFSKLFTAESIADCSHPSNLMKILGQELRAMLRNRAEEKDLTATMLQINN